MSPRAQPRVWRLCRVYFRRFRIFVWLVILSLVGCLLYLNQVGLPGVLKKPILEKLRARGLDVQFSRLRLRFYQGIVADNVRFGRPDDPMSPHLRLAELQLHLNFSALTHLQFQIDSVMLRQGTLLLPVDLTNGVPRLLSLENIGSELRFLPGDLWALDNFRARFAGSRILLSGLVTNASAFRDLEAFHPGKGASHPAVLWQTRLRDLADNLERIHFSAAPELRLDLRGDARDLQSFSLLVLLAAPDADTPWGTLSDGHLTVHLNPVGTDGSSQAELELKAAQARTRWASVTNLQLLLHLHSHASPTNPVSGELSLSALRVRTPWGGGSDVALSAEWLHSITNPVPLAGWAKLRCDSPHTRWARAARLELALNLDRPAPEDLPVLQPDWAWWTNLQPYAVAWHCRLLQPRAADFHAQELAGGGTWRSPQLTVTNLDAQLYGGQFTATGQLDVASRRLAAGLASDFDPHQIAGLLPESARFWLEQIAWQKAPRLQADVSLVLPPWTGGGPGWQQELQRSLSVSGQFELASGAVYHQVQVASARSHFSYSNLCFDLPDLTLTRPEGGVAAMHHSDERTHRFYWRLSSTIDPQALRPLLEPEQQRAFELFTLTQPPWVQAEIWGRSHAPEETGVRGQIAVTNFSFRGESVSALQAGFQYTNRLLQVSRPHIQFGTQYAAADGLTADFNRELVFLTNGVSTADPLLIARPIGPHIVRAIENYQFARPPLARVYGVIPMRGEAGADLHFDLRGGPFHWWKFNLASVAGQVHWLGETLLLSDIQADLYHGRATGWATFDFRPRNGADFKFALTTTNTLLEALLADYSTRTNSVEGRLSGSLVVTSANTEDWRTANGYGTVDLRDGLIWDIPLFGIFSPVLNGLAPGLGNSRAKAATCTFTMTNGVVHTDDLEVQCPTMRMQYRGTVDLEGGLNAHVEAGLLRNVWLVGPLVSTVLWPVTKMFEYRLTGDLDHPKTQPVFLLPKIVLLPFHPLRTLKSLVQESTNAPPGTFSPPPK